MLPVLLYLFQIWTLEKPHLAASTFNSPLFFGRYSRKTLQMDSRETHSVVLHKAPNIAALGGAFPKTSAVMAKASMQPIFLKSEVSAVSSGLILVFSTKTASGLTPEDILIPSSLIKKS